ncbi:hypothetical protein BTVI_71318 [Pitangus sulphuratus]|nr:hypothetical protein BTVI_71318 [Pitangus sulphuratus]
MTLTRLTPERERLGLTRKTDQLATNMNSLVGIKKPAGYPAKPFGSDSLQTLGMYRHMRKEFKPAGSW